MPLVLTLLQGFLGSAEPVTWDSPIDAASSHDELKPDRSSKIPLQQHAKSNDEGRHSQNPAHVSVISSSPRVLRDETRAVEVASNHHEGSNPPSHGPAQSAAASSPQELDARRGQRHRVPLEWKEEGEVGIELQQRHDGALLVSR